MKNGLLTISLFFCLCSLSLGADPSVLLSDDFSKLDPAWGETDEVQSVSGNKLLLVPKLGTSYATLREGSLYGDADIRVKTSLIKGGSEKPAGVMFWAVNYNNYYVAQVFSDGNVRVARRTPSQFIYPVSMKVFDAVKKGIGQENELRVVTIGNSATVYVNDKKIVIFKGFPPEGGGKVGVYGGSADDAYTWAFSDLSVRKPLASTVAKVAAKPGAGVIFADDFSTLDPAWGDADGVQSVAGSKLQLVPKPNTTYSTMYEGNLFGDADIRVKISLLKGGTERPAGIVFWATDYDTYYFAQLFSDGTLGVARRTQGQFLQPVEQRVQGAVKQGVGEVNELRLLLSGNSATIYVNEKEVASFKGFPPKAGSKIGVRAASPAEPYTWTFSELSVRRPAPPTVVQTTPASDDMIFADDFSTLDPGWGTADDVQNVAGNKLLMTPKPNSNYSSLYNGNLFSDSDIRLNVSLTKGGEEAAAAIVFWATDYENYYLAELYSDGTFAVARRMQGKSVYPVQGKVQEVVKKGAGQTNELRVLTFGSYATVYVNDQRIATFRGFPPKGGSKIGVYAGSDETPYTWAFSKLTVRKVSASTDIPRKEPPQSNDPEVIFADDFSMPDAAWGDLGTVQNLAGNKLLLTPSPNKSYATLYNGSLFEDCDMRVKISLSQGGVESPAGIVFWAANLDNYYFARIYTDGLASIARRSEGKWSYPVSTKVYESIKEGVGQTNVLRVVTSGNFVTMYVNDKRIATVKGSPPVGGSKIGLQAESADDPYIWSFSELTVRKSPVPPESLAEKNVLKPLPKEIVDAWEAAGAKVGRMRMNEFGVPGFVLERLAESSGLGGDLPAFQFTSISDPAALAKLPVPTVGFGLMVMMVNPKQSGILKDFAGQKNLQTLMLFGPQITDAGVKGLGELKGLRTLQLLGPKVTDAGLKELAGLVNLQTLTVGCPQMTNSGLRELAGLKNLQTLNASGNQMTDAGLKELVGLQNLRMLNLYGNNITDAGLKELAKMKSLQTLNLGSTKVTVIGLKGLQKELPACRIMIQQ